MDKIGYVVVVGSPFQTPDEVAQLVKSDANPLESKFSPGYSMVLNLLQRFSLEEAKELIFKTFGYFSSTDRLTPLLKKMETQGLVTRTRNEKDERTVYIQLTKEGKAMKSKCANIPQQMMCQNILDMNKAAPLLQTLHQIMSNMTEEEK